MMNDEMRAAPDLFQGHGAASRGAPQGRSRPGDPEQASPRVAVRRLRTPAEVSDAFRDMGRSTRSEILEMVPDRGAAASALRDARQGDLDSLERGVAGYLLCESSCLADPSIRDEIELRLQGGARVRTVDRLPQWTRVFDRRVAVLPSAADSLSDVLVVRERSVIRSLQALFVNTWRNSAEVGGRADAPVGCRARYRDVVEVMSCGATDEVSARRLDVSVRTYRRYVAEVMDVLGANSRFQAGVLAMARGWARPQP